MVPQAARVDARWDERMAQRVHLDERSHLARVPEVVLVTALRHRGDGLRLHGDEPRIDVAVNALADYRIREAREVRASADANDLEIRGDVCELEWLLGRATD